MITTFDEYSIAATKTISGKTAASQMSMLDAAALGLTGESGEFADHVKKILYHDQSLNDERRTKMIKEIGDILWYVNLACGALHIPLTLVADGNIQKLAERHPEGKFDPAYHITMWTCCGNRTRDGHKVLCSNRGLPDLVE